MEPGHELGCCEVVQVRDGDVQHGSVCWDRGRAGFDTYLRVKSTGLGHGWLWL